MPHSPAAHRFVDEVLSAAGFDVRSADLRPGMTTTYRRSTLLLPASQARVTVDTDLRWQLPDGRGLDLPGLAVVETKSGSAASAADRHPWAQGHRPCRLSKYGTGLAALEPRLRGNRWHPVLRRHLTPCASPPTPVGTPREAPRMTATALASLEVSAGSQGADAVGAVTVSGGAVTVSRSEEGLQAPPSPSAAGASP